jgi:hypothetical protein
MKNPEKTNLGITLTPSDFDTDDTTIPTGYVLYSPITLVHEASTKVLSTTE